MFQHGDRVRWATTGDDGLPLVRYGFIGAIEPDDAVVVMLDGELRGDVVDPAQLQEVSMTSVELVLDGDDLLGDAALRCGLIWLWTAEAESAGLDVGDVQPFGDGWRDDRGRWVLAELHSGGQRYLVRAGADTNATAGERTVHVNATPA